VDGGSEASEGADDLDVLLPGVRLSADEESALESARGAHQVVQFLHLLAVTWR
jgi:hypothetical protein